MTDLATAIREAEPRWRARLEEMVAHDTPSREKVLVDRLVDLVQGWAAESGARVERIPQERLGDHLVLRWGEGPRRIFVVGHIDTVWPGDETARRPYTIDGDRALGPGILDMKAGVLIALWALQVIHAAGGLPAAASVVFLVNTDEEIGSPTSRSVIERLAQGAVAALVPEPAGPPHGALKTARSGRAEFVIRTRGRSAHAGTNHAEGINAIVELAHQVLTVTGWTDYTRGTTVSVDLVRGGMRSNVVADEAEATVDVRVTQAAEREALEHRFRQLKPVLPGASVEVSGTGFLHPPMERSAGNVRLYRLAEQLASEIDVAVTETSAGGVSDGCLTATLGVPTLDGLGATGAGAHALHEHVLLTELRERAHLFALLVRALAEGES